MRFDSRNVRMALAVIVGIGAVYAAATLFLDRKPGAMEPGSATSVTPPVGQEHRFEVAVPELTPTAILSSRQETIEQGDAVEFVVTSTRPGTVAVHGFTDMEPVVVGRQISVRFHAIHSGRFALHFHGEDGSHFELMALSVMPGS